VTQSEVEALILEANLIKRYRPRFNVRLKDDKRYPYLKVTAEDFPKVLITRRMTQDGGRYFGPYTSSSALRETLDLLRRLFPFRTCDREITGQDRRACLYADLKLCTAPCIGAVDKVQYQAVIEQLIRFMGGETEEVRDRYQALQLVMERQRVITTAAVNQDVIALARDDGNACVEVFFVRNGKLLGREYFVMEGSGGEETEEIVTAFLKQFYTEAPRSPRLLCWSSGCVPSAAMWSTSRFRMRVQAVTSWSLLRPMQPRLCVCSRPSGRWINTAVRWLYRSWRSTWRFRVHRCASNARWGA